jgi:hypothetical protein
MRPTLSFASVLLLSLAAAVRLQGADFNPAWVAADAQWVGYANVQTLRASPFGPLVIAKVKNIQTSPTNATSAFDLASMIMSVTSVTAYGSSPVSGQPPNDAIILAETTSKFSKATATQLKVECATNSDILEISDLPFTAYSVADHSGPQRAPSIVCFPQEPIVLIGKSKTQLLRAYAIYLGKAPSLARNLSASPLGTLLKIPKHTYVFAAVIVADTGASQNESSAMDFLHLTNQAFVGISSDGSKTRLHALLRSDTVADSDKLAQGLRGMLSIGAVYSVQSPSIAEFMSSISIVESGTNVAVEAACSTTQLVEWLNPKPIVK